MLKEDTKEETCRSVARSIKRPEIVGRVAPCTHEISIDKLGSAERGILYRQVLGLRDSGLDRTRL